MNLSKSVGQSINFYGAIIILPRASAGDTPKPCWMRTSSSWKCSGTGNSQPFPVLQLLLMFNPLINYHTAVTMTLLMLVLFQINSMWLHVREIRCIVYNNLSLVSWLRSSLTGWIILNFFSLVLPEHFEQLVNMVIEEPSSELEERLRYKYDVDDKFLLSRLTMLVYSLLIIGTGTMANLL